MRQKADVLPHAVVYFSDEHATRLFLSNWSANAVVGSGSDFRVARGRDVARGSADAARGRDAARGHDDEVSLDAARGRVASVTRPSCLATLARPQTAFIRGFASMRLKVMGHFCPLASVII